MSCVNSDGRVPVTVLTGFLGAGKTTLLNALLSQNHGYHCAVIINEFGPISIDNQLVLNADEEVLDLNNGCLCCRVRGDLLKSFGDLFRREKRFDYVLVETTGLADPGPVAPRPCGWTGSSASQMPSTLRRNWLTARRPRRRSPLPM
jgi:G3E family GTPase